MDNQTRQDIALYNLREGLNKLNESTDLESILNPGIIWIFVEKTCNTIISELVKYLNKSKKTKSHISSAEYSYTPSPNTDQSHQSYDFKVTITLPKEENSNSNPKQIIIHIDAKAARKRWGKLYFHENQKNSLTSSFDNNEHYYFGMAFIWSYMNNDSKLSLDYINNSGKKEKGSCKFKIDDIILTDLVKANEGGKFTRRKNKQEYYLTKSSAALYKINNKSTYESSIIADCTNFLNSYISEHYLNNDKKIVELTFDFKQVKESWGNLSLGYGQNYHSSMKEPYFEYKILPLSTNLSGKGNKKLTKGELNTYVINQGNYVSGISPIDEKKHWGVIQKMWIPEGDTDIKWIFILDRDTAVITALYPDTVKIASRTGRNEEDIPTGYNKIIKEALDLMDFDSWDDSEQTFKEDIKLNVTRKGLFKHNIKIDFNKPLNIKDIADNFIGMFKELYTFDKNNSCGAKRLLKEFDNYLLSKNIPGQDHWGDYDIEDRFVWDDLTWQYFLMTCMISSVYIKAPENTNLDLQDIIAETPELSDSTEVYYPWSQDSRFYVQKDSREGYIIYDMPSSTNLVSYYESILFPFFSFILFNMNKTEHYYDSGCEILYDLPTALFNWNRVWYPGDKDSGVLEDKIISDIYLEDNEWNLSDDFYWDNTAFYKQLILDFIKYISQKGFIL